MQSFVVRSYLPSLHPLRSASRRSEDYQSVISRATRLDRETCEREGISFSSVTEVNDDTCPSPAASTSQESTIQESLPSLLETVSSEEVNTAQTDAIPLGMEDEACNR